jgi:hypothetical protein
MEPTALPVQDISSTSFVDTVLSDITPSSQPAGLTNLLASVVQKAKTRAAVSLASEAYEAAAGTAQSTESAPLCAAV